MEVIRPTREVVYLIDVDDEAPMPGQQVFALGLGGSLCQVIWTKGSEKFFKAWMPFPKIPKGVKEKLHSLYMNGGWKSGHEFQCNSGAETRRIAEAG